jgi:hypothetical protein
MQNVRLVMVLLARIGDQTASGALHRASATPQFVQVPRLSFLMIDGAGDPNTALAYQDAVEALYSLSYTLKFDLKKRAGLDYHVAALEGLWWADSVTAFTQARKADWQWTMMIAQPDQVRPDLVQQAIPAVQRKKALPALERVRLESFEEGLAAQVLHLGPNASEGPTIERLHQFITAHGYTFDGRVQKHHEIYLSDPRRSAPERLKTVLRQPVVPAPGTTGRP